MQKKDNSTFLDKITIRRSALSLLNVIPVVMETHGGEGKIYDQCYANIQHGIVFEKNESRSEILAAQRPTWSVNNCDTVNALQGSAGKHLEINFLDLDPYGSPWDTIEAFFSSSRPFAKSMIIVVNDGLRMKTQLQGAWQTKQLRSAVLRFGNNIYKIYLEVCKFILTEKVKAAGYEVETFSGYYCGYNESMTHYMAKLNLTSNDNN